MRGIGRVVIFAQQKLAQIAGAPRFAAATTHGCGPNALAKGNEVAPRAQIIVSVFVRSAPSRQTQQRTSLEATIGGSNRPPRQNEMRASDIVKAVLPAPAYDAVKRLLGLPVYSPHRAGEKSDDFYDRTFAKDDYWQRHYTQVDDYACWTVIIDRLRIWKVRRLLEIGCGTGQLAAAIDGAGLLDSYCGFDFSAARLSHARTVSPHLRFEQADALKTDLYSTFDYECTLSTEFLEHIETDISVLNRLRPATRLIATVPNYPFESHVRHFVDVAAVHSRYAPLFDEFEAHPVPLDPAGKTIFIFHGRRNKNEL